MTLETRRALAAVDEPNRIVPWLDTGRFPHDGDPMTAADLRRLLQAAADAGLKRFLYHHQGCLSEGEWVVISEQCGRPWRALRSDYYPNVSTATLAHEVAHQWWGHVVGWKSYRDQWMSESFAELFGKSTTSFKEGEVVKGTVLAVDQDHVTITDHRGSPRSFHRK